MSESLGARVGRIISGGFNALVDAVEDTAPEVVMEQAMREIDEVIADARTELGSLEASSHLAVRRHSEENQRLEELQQKATLALQEQRDDLAEHIAGIGERKNRIEGYIKALQSRKREMAAELKRYRDSQTSNNSSSSAADTPAHPASKQASRENRAEQANSAFDRVFERATGLNGKGNVDPERSSRLSELDDMAHRNRVAERLQRLKSGLPDKN